VLDSAVASCLRPLPSGRPADVSDDTLFAIDRRRVVAAVPSPVESGVVTELLEVRGRRARALAELEGDPTVLFALARFAVVGGSIDQDAAARFALLRVGRRVSTPIAAVGQRIANAGTITSIGPIVRAGAGVVFLAQLDGMSRAFSWEPGRRTHPLRLPSLGADTSLAVAIAAHRGAVAVLRQQAEDGRVVLTLADRHGERQVVASGDPSPHGGTVVLTAEEPAAFSRDRIAVLAGLEGAAANAAILETRVRNARR